MADIFISYSKAERALTAALATELEQLGYSVWWDTNLVSGEQYQKVIVDELRQARAVIVIWTPASTQSEWVYSEANRAAREKKLIPLRVPEVDLYDIPPPFDVRQTDLIENRAAIYTALARLGVPPSRSAAKSSIVEPSRTDAHPTSILSAPPRSTSAQSPISPVSQIPRTDLPPIRPVTPSAIRPAWEPPHSPVHDKTSQQAPQLPTDGARVATSADSIATSAIHWRKTRMTMATALSLWLVLAVITHAFARELNYLVLLGFPFGYYMAAQGSLLTLLALTVWFVRRQNRLDVEVASTQP